VAEKAETRWIVEKSGTKERQEQIRESRGLPTEWLEARGVTGRSGKVLRMRVRLRKEWKKRNEVEVLREIERRLGGVVKERRMREVEKERRRLKRKEWWKRERVME